MIRFSLICEKEHEFEGWFSSSDDFDKQKKRGLVGCPSCGSVRVSKALMAPSVVSRKESKPVAVAGVDPAQREAMRKLRELRDAMLRNSVDVGEQFASEARKIHLGESDKETIHGQARSEEVRELLEDGIEILPLPVLPDDAN